MALIPVVSQEFTIRESRHASAPVNATRPFTWIDYFGTIVKSNKENTIIATIILPVADDNEAQQILRTVNKSTDNSGNFSLSFNKGGRKFTYSYRNDKNGLLLQNINL